MKKISNTEIAAAALLFAGMIAWIADPESSSMLAGIFIGAGITVFTQNALSNFGKKKRKRRTTAIVPAAPHATENKMPAIAESAVTEEISKVQPTALSSDYRKKQWLKTEEIVDKMLDGFISVIAAKLPHNTVAVFFPTQGDSFILKRHASKSTRVNRDAQIIPRRGLLGSIITDDDKLRPLFYEPNFTNSNATLYYYDDEYDFKPEETIRSIMLAPIEADGDVRGGMLLVDHTAAKAYSVEDQTFLSDIAKLLGRSIYYAYTNTQNSLDYQRLSSINKTMEDFWKELEFDAVMNKMRDIIPYAIPCCDRLTISLKDEDKSTAVIWRAYGRDAEGLEKLQFQIGDGNPRAIASMAFFKEYGFYRNFHESHYEYRFNEDEPQSGAFASFMAVPFGSGKGLMLVESTQRDIFTDPNVVLLKSIGNSAGSVLQKIFFIREKEALSVRDGLTNLYNHRQFQKILAAKISAYSRKQKPVSISLCDIDFFKKLNDTYGHPFGDVVLKGVAAKLESCIRIDIDAVARYGGEEFVLIFDETDTDAAKDTVERIRQAVEEMSFRTSDGSEVKTSMSFGMATYPDHARDLNELIQHADKALYKAKKNGRNRVEVY